MDRGHQPHNPVSPAAQLSRTIPRGVLPTDPRRKRSAARSRRRWMLVPCLLGVLILDACGGESENPYTPMERKARTGTADCKPTGTQLRIAAGEPTHTFSTDCLAAPASKPFTIRFTNRDESTHGQHNIAIEGVSEGEMIDGHGESITYKIGPRRAGTYKFLCNKHPFMDGVLVVK
jgi:plastocyanin